MKIINMNKLLFFSVLFFLCSKIMAQSPWSVFPSLGTLGKVSNIVIHSTIGQPLSTVTANSSLYSQGFQFDNRSLHVAIHQLSDDVSVRLYPNPTSDLCTLDFGEYYEGEVKISSLDGLALYQKSLRANRIELNLSGFNSGLYLLECHSQKFKFNSTIIVQH